MLDYLDYDVAYFLGMIIARGKIIQNSTTYRINIEFPFTKPAMGGFSQFHEFISSIATKILPRAKNLLGKEVDIYASESSKTVSMVINLPIHNIASRNFKLLLKNKTSYREFRVPDVIKNASDTQIVKEFMRGFADVAGNIRRSNRYIQGRHRVFLDVLFPNWRLPVELCFLLQNKLDVPVHSILWSHPNLRGGKALPREHQIRIYASDFLKIGFYIDFKQKLLELLVAEDETYGRVSPTSKCKGLKRYRRKPRVSEEKNEILPKVVRTHFDAFWEICAIMGCPYAKPFLEEKRRELFEGDD